MPQPFLQLRQLTTGYGTHPVGKGLSADLAGGSLCALLAANGAGKSTLLRTLAGFLAPLGGSIRCMDKDLLALSPSQLSRMVSVVLTTRPQAEALTVQDVVEMGRIPYSTLWHGLSQKDRDRVAQAMQQTSVVTLAHRMVSTLSDGERQRVFVAKSLAQDTPIILLDEPTAFLDFPSKVGAFRMLSELAHEKRKAILVSTHDVELALHFADELWLLRPDGITTGTPSQLAEDGSIGRFFQADGISFDSCHMRFVPEPDGADRWSR